MAFRTKGSSWQIARVKQNLAGKTSKGLIMSAPLQIGIVLFPRVTQLDFTGPLQVFSSVPGAQRCI